MRIILIIAFLFSLSSIVFGQNSLNKKIKTRLKTQLESESIKNVFFHIYSESKNIDIQLVESKNAKVDSLNINNPFYTASITKMLTATSIGLLRDKGKLNFEDNITKYLPKALWNKLHYFKGKDYTKEITIAHLLNHSSGLPDYFTDQTFDGSPNIINQLLIHTDKIWSPQEVLEFTKERMKPHFIPGDEYRYSDSNYVLLALIIENISGNSFDEFLKKHIFQPLGMNNSYINLKSLPLSNTRSISKFYVADVELSLINSLSSDWGGGGLVSNTKDLITFFQAFNANKIVKVNTRIEMQKWVNESIGTKYGYGIRKVSLKDFNEFNGDFTLLGHTGSTASFLWYCIELDTYIAGTFNQLEASKSTLNFVMDTIKIIENE
ncbi:serine hydrolase [Aquimarina sp. AU474]|uniref:serine hydrolase domain-containing protein n=1 Tax=Aquimarina sp. AU474 TaxID=2108529 RepID=UPI000D685D27|nr:serine hydrolase domain-containing protein [Aquimarina sp. AU474]